MNVTQKKLLYVSAQIDVAHIGIDNYLKHHFRMIRTTPGFFIKFLETLEIEMINNSADYANRIIRRYIFICSLRNKERFD